MKKKKSEIGIFTVYIIAIILLWVISIIILNLCYDSDEIKGQFGDSFGALNALFSGLAFAGIIFTIQLQRKELSLQRKELKMTRKELKRSASAQEKTEEVLREQMKLHKKETSYNYIDSMLNKSIITYKTYKEDLLIPGHISEYLYSILSSYGIGEHNHLVEYIENNSLKLFTLTNQLTYILEEINISFADERKTKFFWTTQLNDRVEEIRLRSVFKISKHLDEYKKKNFIPPFNDKLKALLDVCNTLENRIKANYLEFDRTRENKKLLNNEVVS